jgi:transposase-like protein
MRPPRHVQPPSRGFATVARDRPIYPILYIDALVIKVRTSGVVTNRPAYVAVGVDVEGRKHVLGVWLGDGGEGAKFWLAVLTELSHRGLHDVIFVCCDGLKGLPDAIEAIWPAANVQTCVVHYADFRIMPMWSRDPRQGRGFAAREVGIIP